MNVKTKGITVGDKKAYEITNKTSGEVHVAHPEGGGRFSMGIHTGTLKSCKELVATDSVFYSWDKLDAAMEADDKDVSPWDNLNPAAALILWADHNPHVERILDNMGALDENGQPDLEWAKDELDRWKTKLGAN